MNFVEKAYSTVIGGIFIFFIFCRAANGLSTILSTYCRPFLLTNLVYPASHSGFWSWLPPPLHLVLMVLYSVGTGVCNLIGVQSVSEAGSRAARLSLANLVPMFLSGGFEFGSRLLGVSLETYGAIHRAVGVMAVVQAGIHVAITIQTTPIPAADSRQFYGLLVQPRVQPMIYSQTDISPQQGSCMFLSVVFLPLVKKRVYDVFLKTHQGCALIALYAIWKHTHALPNSNAAFYIMGCVGLVILSQALHLACYIFEM